MCTLSLSPIRRRRGFTLIELLVVVTIIAILAGLGFTGYSSAMRAAKRVKAAQQANGLNNAVLAYYTEYSVYPAVGGAGSGDYTISGGDSAGDWVDLATALNGNLNPATFTETADPEFNRRNIDFLDIKPEDLDSAGAPISPIRNGAGSWYYAITMDTEYNNYVEPDNSGDGVGEGVAVWLPINEDIPATTPQIGTFEADTSSD